MNNFVNTLQEENPLMKNFIDILTAIRQKGITTKAALMADQQLYDSFMPAARDFATFCLFSKNGKVTKAGKQLLGNNPKVDSLEAHGITTRKDITSDCVVRMVEYATNMLQKSTVENMKNYAYSIVNSRVNNLYRALSQDDIKLISLNSLIEGTGIAAEGAYTYEDIIADNTYNPERLLVECETIKELTKELKAKRAKERAEKKETILYEIALLSKHPAEAMVRLACTHLGMKPCKLASLILDKGCDLTYAGIIFSVAKKNNIELASIRSIIADHKVTAESVKADTNDHAAVAAQISRLAYKAAKRIEAKRINK